MSRRNTDSMVIIVAILIMARSATPQDLAKAEHHGGGYDISLTGGARLTIAESLQGAIRRLSRPECQQVFEDFSDHAGRPLAMNLAASGQSPAELLTRLSFVEGNDTILCRADQRVAAFTTRGSRVIHVCGSRFLQFSGNTKGGEIVLIHELLHSLGLGENPPNSSWITTAVLKRCG
jgi:hypothetical protein